MPDDQLDLDALSLLDDEPLVASSADLDDGRVALTEGDAPIAGTTPYGWCMTGSHDTATARGGCPIQAGSLLACNCSCHNGDTEPRGYLPPVTTNLPGEE